MDRYRLITSIVVLFIYLLAMYPVQTIVISIVLVFSYLVLSNMGQGRLGSISARNNGKEVRRRKALKNAKLYLAPYKSIWRNLKLSNKFCELKLGTAPHLITAKEKTAPNRTFRIIHSNVHSYIDLWDMFCMNFDYNTTFDGLIESCNKYKVNIIIENNERLLSKSSNIQQEINNEQNSQQTVNKEKLDINNASEVEITALPGVSIVLAKKLIKKREEINGFKTVDDVCLFLHLKPHMESQLKELICVKKMKGSDKIKRYNERSVDL